MDEKRAGLEVRESIRHKVARFLFGSDVFISYGRADGTDYSLKLANELTKREIVCGFDQWGTESGEGLPPRLLLAISRSTMFVLVGSPAAAGSENVRKEVEAFPRKDRILPISFDSEDKVSCGSLEKSPWFSLVHGQAIRYEPLEALKPDGPAPATATIERIVNAEGFVSRNARLRRTFTFTVIAIAALLAAGGMFLGLQARETARQQKLAESFRLASEAEDLREQPDDLEKSVRRAAQALQGFRELDTVSLAADRTLRHGLDLLRPCLADIPAGGGAPLAVALNRDGSLAAVAGTRVEVWSIAPSEREARCRHKPVLSGSIPCAAGGCRAVAFVSGQESLAVVDAVSVRVCTGWSGTARCDPVSELSSESSQAVLSADGRMLAIVDKLLLTANVLNLVTHELHSLSMTAALQGCRIHRMAVSPEGPLLAFSVFSGPDASPEVRVVSVPGGVLLARFAAGRNDNYFGSALALSRDGRRVAVSIGRNDHEVLVWDLATEREILRLPLGIRTLATLAFSPDGETLAGGGLGRGAESSAQVWDLFNRNEVSRFVQPGAVGQVAFSEDGRRLAVASREQSAIGAATVRVWDAAPMSTDVPLYAFRESPPFRAALSRDGRYMAIEKKDALAVWEIANRRLVIDERRAPAGRFFFSPGGRYFVTPDRAWELPAGSPANLPRRIRSFAAADRLLVSVGASGDFAVSAPGVPGVAARVPAPAGAQFPELSPGGSFLAAPVNSEVRLWALSRDGQPPRELHPLSAPEGGAQRHQVRIEWSPDERFMAVLWESGGASIQDLTGKGGARACVKQLSGLADLEFAGEDRLVAVFRDSNRGSLRVCRMLGSFEEWTVPLTDRPTMRSSLALAPGGRVLSVALDDGSIEVWDLDGRNRLTHVGAGVTPPSKIAFTPDGHSLAALYGDGSARLLLWRPEDLLREAYRRLGEPPPARAEPK